MDMNAWFQEWGLYVGGSLLVAGAYYHGFITGKVEGARSVIKYMYESGEKTADGVVITLTYDEE